MSKKIAVVAPMGIDLSEEIFREIAGRIFVKNANKLKDEETLIDFFIMKKGFVNIDSFSWESLNVWNSYELFEMARGLRGKGYDAMVIHCYADPCLYPLRQLMDIPVVGAVQNSLIFAGMMGRKIGIVTFSKYFAPIVEELVVKYGYKDSVVSIRSTESKMNDFFESFTNAGPLLDKFCEVSRACIADGAEVLVPG